MADADTRWIKIDDYLERTVATDAAELNPIRQAQEDGGLPDIAVSATQGKFLYLLATIAKARRVLEIGTLGGYSTAWLAKAVGPEGAVVTSSSTPNTPPSRRPAWSRRAWATGFGFWWAPPWNRCLPSRARSIWCSSTPTSPTTRAIWTGHCGSPSREQSSWWITSFAGSGRGPQRRGHPGGTGAAGIRSPP